MLLESQGHSERPARLLEATPTRGSRAMHTLYRQSNTPCVVKDNAGCETAIENVSAEYFDTPHVMEIVQGIGLTIH